MSTYYSYLLTEARSDFILQNKKLIEEIWYVLCREAELRLDTPEEKRIEYVKNFLKELEQNKFISKYLNWVVKQFINTDWRYPEDISKIENNLNKFYRSLGYLKNNGLETDLNKYNMKSFNQLILDLPETTRQEDINIKNNEIEVLYEDSNWLLLTPKTERAAIKYGKGTTWCTAATEGDNLFNWHNNKGPLYIMINQHNKKEKYQFHLPTEQFMDATDDRVLPDEMNEIINSDKGLHDTIEKIVFDYYGKKDIEIEIQYGELREFLDSSGIELGLNTKTFMEAAFDESIDELDDWDTEAEEILQDTVYVLLAFIRDKYDVPCLKDGECRNKINDFICDSYNTKSSITPLNNLKKVIYLALNDSVAGSIYNRKKTEALEEDMKEFSKEALKEILNAKSLYFYYDSVEVKPQDISHLSEHLTELIYGEEELSECYLYNLNVDDLKYEYYYDATPDDWEYWVKENVVQMLSYILTSHQQVIEDLKEYNPREPYTNGVEEDISYDPWEENYNPFGDREKEE